MQLNLNDCLYGNGYEYLRPGPCGPVYVNQVWSEEVSAGAFCDKYYDLGCPPYMPRTMFKAEIECESPEVLNSILRQIANIVACPFDDPVQDITSKAQEEITAKINDEILNTLLKESIDKLTEEIRLEAEKCKRYKLKHKVLYKC